MKAFFAVCIATFLCLLGGVQPHSTPPELGESTVSSPEIRVSHVEGYSGNLVSVDIFYKDFEQVGALSLLIMYDSNILSLTNSEIGPLFANPYVSINTSTRGVFYFSSANLDGVTGSGLLFRLEFFIPDEQAPITLPISVAIEEVVNLSFEEVSVHGISGSISVLKKVEGLNQVVFYSQVNRTAFYQDDIVELYLKSEDLKDFAAGSFGIIYPSHLFEFVDYTLSNSWNHSESLHVLSVQYPGLIHFSYASLLALQEGNPILTVRFKVISHSNGVRSDFIVSPKSVYDVHLKTMESLSSSVSVYSYPRSVAAPKIYLSSYTGPRGVAFELDVMIDANSNIAAGDFVISYSPSRGTIVEVITFDSENTKEGMVVVNPNFGNGQLKFSLIHESGYKNETRLLRFRFVPNPEYSGNYFYFTPSLSGVVDTNFQAVPIDIVYRTVELKTYRTITYLGFNDEVIEEYYVPEHSPITPPSPPLIFGQTFTGWDKTVTTAYADLVVKAVYQSNNTVFVQSKSVPYNGQIQVLNVQNLPEGATAHFEPSVFPKDVGEYPYTITISHPNYEDLVLQATLTITKKSITIQADSLWSQFGNPVQPLTYQIIGDIYDDVIEVELSASIQNAIGSYPILPIASHRNYQITLVAGVYQVKGIPVDVSQLQFENQTYVYDGTKKTMTLSGTLPPGVIGIEYANNELTEVGSIVAVAKFICEEGYEVPQNKIATLTISRALITGITFESDEFIYDGTAKSLTVSSLLAPYGEQLTIEYIGQNQASQAGSYPIIARLTHPNYQTLELSAMLTIAKRATIITEDQFTFDEMAHQIKITTSIDNRVIATSLNGLTYQEGSTISALDEMTTYTISLYLVETDNELASNILTFSIKTAKDVSELLSMTMGSGMQIYANYSKIQALYHALEEVHPSEYDALYAKYTEWVNAYNQLIELWNQQFIYAKTLVEQTLPTLPTLQNYPLVYLPERRRDEQ